MESFSDWWSGLSLMLKVYWALALPFTVMFLLQLLLSFMGHDSADDVPDAEVNADHGIGFQFFTLKNLIGFFTIFGWAGIAMTEAGAGPVASISVAFIAGALMMGVM